MRDNCSNFPINAFKCGMLIILMTCVKSMCFSTRHLADVLSFHTAILLQHLMTTFNYIFSCC